LSNPNFKYWVTETKKKEPSVPTGFFGISQRESVRIRPSETIQNPRKEIKNWRNPIGVKALIYINPYNQTASQPP